MNKILIGALALSLASASAATAQTTITGAPATKSESSATSGGQEAVTRPNTDKADRNNPATTATLARDVKLERGANSFTEGEARSRIERSGFADVGQLAKDDQGIWRGPAMLDGKSVTVGLDFKGNVAAQ